MKILKRNVEVTKPEHEIVAILKSCAYSFPSAVFDGTRFSFYFPRRATKGGLYLTQVKGLIREKANGATVCLEIQANPVFLIGGLFASIGICGLLFCLIAGVSNWFACLGSIVFGLLFCGIALCNAVEILDHIEHKLTRKVEDGSVVPTLEDEN